MVISNILKHNHNSIIGFNTLKSDLNTQHCHFIQNISLFPNINIFFQQNIIIDLNFNFPDLKFCLKFWK